MINVTKPFLPPLEELTPMLEEIWASGLLSNGGPFHGRLETELSDYLGLEHVSLFCNATIALITAQQSLNLRGQIITTPYSFVATSHALHWMQNEPIFVDIEPDSLCIDPARIEEAITPETVAIMPLHCYGNTCDVSAIEALASQHGLKVIYDACHSFGVEDGGGSVLRHGDISVVSFHATKVFNTFEGGLLVAPDAQTKQKIDQLKNFGFVNETTVIQPGQNGKMSEFNAAVGVLQLQYLESAISRREALDQLYRELLTSLPGITCLSAVRQTKRNYAYFPILVEDCFGLSRDALYERLKEAGIYARRYFYPLITEFPMYQGLPSAKKENLPVAHDVSRRVICLPLYPDLADPDVTKICDVITSAAPLKRALLVDTNFSAAPIAAALSRDGFQVCTVGARPSDSLALNHSHYIQTDYSLPGTLESVIDQYGIDLLVPGCNDVSYEVCCEVANRLGLQGFEAVASLQRLHRKDQFRSLCEALSIPVPKTYATVEEGLEAPGSLMIKPIDAYSGKGVQVIHQPERGVMHDALSAASSASSRGTALIEDFVEGQLYSYSAFLQAGRVQMAFNVIEFGSVNPFVVDTSYVLGEQLFESQLKANVETLAEALDIRRGLMHLQYIANESQYWVIEPTRRCPGDLYSELIQRSTGYPYAKAYASAFVGGDLPEPGQVRPEYTVRHTLAAGREGVFDHVQCLNSAKLTSWYSLASSGARLTPSPGGRVAVAFFTAGSEGESRSLVEDLRAGRVLKIQFRDDLDGL